MFRVYCINRAIVQKTLLGAFWLNVLLYAQSGGNVHGLVLAPAGSPLGDVSVKLFLPSGEVALREGSTNSNGQFVIVEVRPDYYDVVVEAQGFSRETIRGVKVEPGRPTVLAPLRLRTGQFAQATNPGERVTTSATGAPSATAVAQIYTGLGSSVEVRDLNPVQETVQTIGAEVASTISKEQVQGLPLLDRDPMALIRTQAGVFSSVSAGNRNYTVVNGLRTSYANMTLDGVNIQRNYIRGDALESDSNRLFLDQVSEFTLVTSNASAAFGGGASQVVFVTPSGTNRLHGAAYWAHRGSAPFSQRLAAQPPGDAPVGIRSKPVRRFVAGSYPERQAALLSEL